jgi:Fur family transcriptional regulator, peroxide stress response regulator
VAGGDRIPEDDFEQRISLFARALRESGMRLTHQRLEIVREIACCNRHADVEAIYRGVRERVPTISLDTVYRTLGSLERLGLIRRLEVLGGPTRYDTNLEHHHHFICARCGLIRDVYDASYDDLSAPGSVAGLGVVESINVQLRGVCKECQGSKDLERKGRADE